MYTFTSLRVRGVPLRLGSGGGPEAHDSGMAHATQKPQLPFVEDCQLFCTAPLPVHHLNMFNYKSGRYRLVKNFLNTFKSYTPPRSLRPLGGHKVHKLVKFSLHS